MCFGVVLALALAASTAAPLSAQQIEARILGRLVDSSGAALPGVTVTATATQTGATRVVVTDGSGDFGITNLGPGAYTVQFELSGFAAETRQVVLGLAQVETMNLTLGVAAVEGNDHGLCGSSVVIDLSSARSASTYHPKKCKVSPSMAATSRT